jgi:hypothetical protein
VLLSSKPNAQVSTALGIMIVWTLYSLKCCPYPKYLKVFIHINELVYIGQIAMIAYAVFMPEADKLVPSYLQLGFNGVQVASMIVFSLLMALRIVYGICKEQTQGKNKVINAYMRDNDVS